MLIKKQDAHTKIKKTVKFLLKMLFNKAFSLVFLNLTIFNVAQSDLKTTYKHKNEKSQ